MPLSEGTFDLDDYIDYLIEFLETIGEETGERAAHARGVPAGGPGLCRDRTDERRRNRWRPKTLTMMGGPIDTRQAPDRREHHGDGAAARLVREERHRNGPALLPGCRPEGLSGFPAARRLHDHEPRQPPRQPLWKCSSTSSKATRKAPTATQKFYDEYRSVADMTAEFYLQTVDVVFQRHLLPKGELKHRGNKVDPSAIKDTALLAIEGERDDISGIGQTKAALDISTGAGKGEEGIFPRQGCRSLRHLQRPQVAREDRSGRRGLDRQERLNPGEIERRLAADFALR